MEKFPAGRTEAGLSAIKKDLKEAPAEKGAYFCDYETFKNLYRTQARLLMRSGRAVAVALLWLLDAKGRTLSGPAAAPAVRLLKRDILLSLRRSDTVAACGDARFIAMLPLTDCRNAERAMQRIARRFEGDCGQGGIQITYKLGPVEPLEKLNPGSACPAAYRRS